MKTATGGILLAIALSLCALVWSESPCERADGIVIEGCVP